MAWIEISVDDVKTRFAGAELTALQQKALSLGQGDPVPVVIAEVVDQVRGYVAACSQNTLGAGATVPAKLKSAALAMVRFEALNRLGLSVSEDRRESYKQAIRLMEQVAACKFALDQPAEADDAAIGAQSPRIREKEWPRRLP